MADINLNFQSPLTEQNFKEITDALEAIRMVKYQIGLAKKAGIDVSSQEKAALDSEEKLIRIKSVYFPGR